MGTPAIQSLLGGLNGASNGAKSTNSLLDLDALFRLGRVFNAEAPALPAVDGTESETDSLAQDDSGQLTDAFNAIVYRSQMQKVSMSASYQEAAARVSSTSEDGSQVVEAASKQLSFSFFAESRTEELAAFSQRTSNTADGLEGSQKSTYIEASRVVAQRFSFSMTISGEALSGYAGASEALQNNGDSEGFDSFLNLVNKTLAKADDVLNEVFKLLNDFFNGTSDLQTRAQKFMDGLSELGLLGDQNGQNAGQANGTPGSQTTFQAFGLNIQMEFSFESVEVTQGVVQQSDPVTLDLDGDGIELTSYTNGARFDITGSGTKVNTAFVTGGDAFLAIDRNGNGIVDSGKELFGDQNGAANGFEELRKLDSNNDGRINASDRDFASLLLFKDNGNGASESGELISLKDAGIDEISLGYRNTDEAASGGNRLGQVASFRYADGRRGVAADTILNYTA